MPEHRKLFQFLWFFFFFCSSHLIFSQRPACSISVSRSVGLYPCAWFGIWLYSSCISLLTLLFAYCLLIIFGFVLSAMEIKISTSEFVCAWERERRAKNVCICSQTTQLMGIQYSPIYILCLCEPSKCDWNSDPVWVFRVICCFMGFSTFCDTHMAVCSVLCWRIIVF